MKRIVLLAVTAALGLAAALGVTAKPAQAWDIGALPAPYTVSLQVQANLPDCQQFYVVSWYDQSVTINFGQNSHGGDCNSQFQYQLDSFVDATINLTPPVTTTVPPVTTDAVTTTTAPVTTAAPPTTTDSNPPVQTVTVTTTVVDPTIDARLAALETNYAALAARVDAIAKANTAAWDAFVSMSQAGASATDAALAARSAGWNAIYQLGV